jgi:hypothetical protein
MLTKWLAMQSQALQDAANLAVKTVANSEAVSASSQLRNQMCAKTTYSMDLSSSAKTNP